MAKVTIFDVAKRAGVSPATVSRVMNSGICSDKSKAKVIKAINELEFIPNQSARNLGSVNNSKRIAIIIPNTTSFAYMQMIEGIKDITKIYGYDYTLYTIGSKSEYSKLVKEIEKSSEYLSVIEICPYKEIKDKIVTTLFDPIFKVRLVDDLFANKIFIDTGKDNNLQEYLTNSLLKKAKVENKSNKADVIIVDSIERAATWLNKKCKQQIYCLEACKQTGRLLPIKHLNIDFYSIGVILVRYAMKSIVDQTSNKTIYIDI